MSAQLSAVKLTSTQSVDPVEIAKTLAVEFAKTAPDYDKTGEFSHPNFQALFESGLLGLVTAAEQGGWGEGLEKAQAVISTIASGDPSTALILAMHYSVHFAVKRGKWPAALASKVLTANVDGLALINNAQAEPGMGSPAHGGRPETVARIEDGHWIVSGRKSFVTGLPGLKWAIVLALTEEEAPRLVQLLVPLDAKGISYVKAWEAAGMYGTASHDLVLENVRVPLGDLVAEQPASEPLRRDEADGHNFFTLLPAVYQGVALSARNDLLKHLNGHAPSSLGAPLSSIPRIQEGLGQIEVLLATNRRLLTSLARDVDRGTPVGTDALAVRHVVIDNAVSVTDLALELGGNRGLRRDYGLERHHRDAITARAHAPQNHMIRTTLGKAAINAATK
ncbi:acyl-CoA dehydrogenase family protein [Agrobacterium sp. rho-13.3]|uniref:acyl-CoA dehydrogenase family protein n=1 Tax=Agrobacterium sp. rho-13.3 TaxID=3072980 RepID=UPI002A0B8BF9|nr:acyl-CoA dehydrogenase family protein [Agrobacterium sp. rho-13.3]MDX8308463.1 acyl-CoA dehydrogenase family protein [Agrobacterium sp. rho-13.3]